MSARPAVLRELPPFHREVWEAVAASAAHAIPGLSVAEIVRRRDVGWDQHTRQIVV